MLTVVGVEHVAVLLELRFQWCQCGLERLVALLEHLGLVLREVSHRLLEHPVRGGLERRFQILQGQTELLLAFSLLGGRPFRYGRYLGFEFGRSLRRGRDLNLQLRVFNF